MSRTHLVPVVAIVGATAAGKSGLALDLAEELGGEIVNTDAMQVYRGMDVGTAKLPVAERRGVVHHLIDTMEIEETANVAEFQVDARAVIEDCRDRGVTPVLVGGSALYTRAVLDDLRFPGTDPVVRARLELELAAHGPGPLHQRLRSLDAEAAAHIEPGNGRRIVRALEVIELTGSFTARLPEPAYAIPGAIQIGVDIDRNLLDQRIGERVHRMWADGLVAEVSALEPRLRASRTAAMALGYRQVLDFLAGRISEAEAREQTIRGTRRFARKQDSWFRKDPRVAWIAHDDPDRVRRVVEMIRRQGD